MALFDTTQFDEEISILNLEIEDKRAEAADKQETVDALIALENAYVTYKDAKPTFQTVLRNYYDPVEDVFSASVDPYLTAGQKTYIRGLFN